MQFPHKLIPALKPFAEAPAPPDLGERKQISWYSVETIRTFDDDFNHVTEYVVSSLEEVELTRVRDWSALCRTMNWTAPSLGDEAIKQAEHARRWKTGDTFEGEPIRYVYVVSHWHVVLITDTQTVELDVDDTVLVRRQNSVAVPAPKPLVEWPIVQQKTQEPEPLGCREAEAPRGGDGGCTVAPTPPQDPGPQPGSGETDDDPQIGLFG